MIRFAGSIVFCLLFTLLASIPTVAEDELTGVSPLYTEYNTFIKAANFLELVSTESGSPSVKVSFYKIDGSFQKAVRVELNGREQRDLDVNTLVGLSDTYGVVKVEYNNAPVNVRLQGRMSIYRLENDQSNFSFAYALPLRAPLMGTTILTSNTYDPQGRGFVIPNWVSITNLSAGSETFTHNIYDQAGSLLSSEAITLAPFQRRDVAGSVGSTEAVFLNEIVPSSGTAEYLAGVIRYASNTKPSGLLNSYLYALPIFAVPGTGDARFLPISNRSGDCFEQTNWVETLNVSGSNATVTLKYRNAAGTLIDTSSINLPPRAQFHFNASEVLDLRNAELGVVEVASDVADSLVAQSVVYYHSCNSNALQTAYNVQARTVPTVPLTGSYNRFLDIDNQLFVYGVGGLNRSVALQLISGGVAVHNSSFNLPARGANLLLLNEEMFNTTVDTYGLIGLDSAQPYPFMAQNLRLRMDGNAVDFVVPIPVR